jgi:hypothetical protein
VVLHQAIAGQFGLNSTDLGRLNTVTYTLTRSLRARPPVPAGGSG